MAVVLDPEKRDFPMEIVCRKNGWSNADQTCIGWDGGRVGSEKSGDAKRFPQASGVWIFSGWVDIRMENGSASPQERGSVMRLNFVFGHLLEMVETTVGKGEWYPGS